MNSEQQASLDWDIADIIQMIASHLSDERRSQVPDRARSIVTPGARVAALVGLAESESALLKESIRGEALTIARSIEMPWYRFRAMVEVLYVSDEAQQKLIVDELLSFLPDIPGAWNQRRALFMVSGFLAGDIADKAVNLARSFEDNSIRVQLLAKLSRYLSDDEKLEVLSDLKVLYVDETQQSLLLSLLNLAGNLSPALKIDVLKHVEHITRPGMRIQLLTKLITLFPDQKENFLAELPDILLNNKGEADYFWNLLAVADSASEPQRGSLIEEARNMAQEMEGQLKVQYLAQIVHYLDDDEKTVAIHDVLKSARDIDDPIYRAKSLGVLISILPDPLRSSIADEAWAAVTA